MNFSPLELKMELFGVWAKKRLDKRDVVWYYWDILNWNNLS